MRVKETKHARRITCLCLLYICVSTLLPSCREKAQPAPQPPSVEVVAVEQRDVPVQTDWVATTDGIVNATIRAQVQGYLWKQDYQEGEFVKKGQMLFEIDPRPFEAALNQANAALEQAQASLNQARSQVAVSEAQHYIAETNLVRVRPLAEENAISQKDLDDAIGTERSTLAGIGAAKSAAGAAEAAVLAAEANVERAKLDLGFTKIAAPIDGIAGIATAQVGDLVGPTQATPLATVSTVNPIEVYFNVSEQAYLNFMRQFQTEASAVITEQAVDYQLILSDGSVFPYKGTFHTIDRQVDPRTGTIRMAVLFPNPDNVLRPGQFAKVRTMQVMRGALLVPQRAVTQLQTSNQVAVVDANSAIEIRPVKTGQKVGEHWIIMEGLAAGERVVAEGTQKVRQGMVVNPVEAAPQPAADAPSPPATG